MERSYSVTTGNLYTCQSNKPGPYEIELSDSSKKKKKKSVTLFSGLCRVKTVKTKTILCSRSLTWLCHGWSSPIKVCSFCSPESCCSSGLKKSAVASSVLVTWKQKAKQHRGRGQAAAVSEDLQVWSGSGSVLRGPLLHCRAQGPCRAWSPEALVEPDLFL